MPGLVAFGRRWSLGSDDLVLPALASLGYDAGLVFLLACAFPSISAAEENIANRDDLPFNSLEAYYAERQSASPLALRLLRLELTGLVAALLLSLMTEACLGYVATRGSVMEEGPRVPGTLYLLYARGALLFLTSIICVLGMAWLAFYFPLHHTLFAAHILIAVVVAQLLCVLLILFCVWCFFDTAGRKWVNARRRAASNQSSMDEEMRKTLHQAKPLHHRSHLELVYHASWRRRVRLLLCCVDLGPPQTPHRRGSILRASAIRPRAMSVMSFVEDQDSFSEVARVLSDFFWESDLVPSDLVTGLILLRKLQQAEKRKVLSEAKETYQFLSGAAITPNTQFLPLTRPETLRELRDLNWYLSFALSAYGWPYYVRYHDGFCCRLLTASRQGNAAVEEDNCCGCNGGALSLTLPDSPHISLIYANFHCEVGETPFFVAVDRDKREIIIAIRGTLALSDVITDLTANLEEIPVKPRPETPYLGHKGINCAANYVLRLLDENKLIERAQEELGDDGKLVVVGHSLGAGAATILGLLLRRSNPTLTCYAYSPPGGLLNWEGAEATRDWVKTVVVGKDFVSRLSLYNLELIRAHIIHLLQHLEEVRRMFLPGRILHIVRTWTKETRRSGLPEYAALWADPGEFDQILVSPVMIHDHMPDGLRLAMDRIVSQSEELVSSVPNIKEPLHTHVPTPQFTALPCPNTTLRESERLKSASTPGILAASPTASPRVKAVGWTDMAETRVLETDLDQVSYLSAHSYSSVQRRDILSQFSSRRAIEAEKEGAGSSSVFASRNSSQEEEEEEEEDETPSAPVNGDTGRGGKDSPVRRVHSTADDTSLGKEMIHKHQELTKVKSEACGLGDMSPPPAPIHRAEDLEDLRGSVG